ncbi:nectin-3-like isoform X2 [Mustelus asterias]
MPSFTAILLLLTVRLNSASAGPIKMNGKQIVRALHDNVLLPCTIITNKPISQFMWKLMRGQQELNIFTADFRNGKHQHFDEKFDGRITYVGQDHKNASIYFKNLTLQDEGIYRCIFTLFPDGPFEEEIQLTLTVPPTIMIQTYPVFSPNDCSERLGITCIAANAKPAANINWEMPFAFNASEHIEPPAPNGTVTVSSHFHLCPARSMNGQNVSCIVRHPTLNSLEQVSYKLNITYAARSADVFHKRGLIWGRNRAEGSLLINMSSVIVRPQKTELGSLYLVCSADANPPAIKFIWTKDNGPIPEGVIIENDRVKLIKLTPDLYGLYLCEASNAVGAASGSLYLFTGDHQPRKYIILLIVIILVLVFVIGILSYCYHRKMQTNKETSPEVWMKYKWMKMKLILQQIES